MLVLSFPVLTRNFRRQSGSFDPSRMKVYPGKMALLSQGGGYGAIIENGRQDGRGEEAQGRLCNGPQTKNTGA